MDEEDRMKRSPIYTIGIGLFWLMAACAPSDNFVVHHQATGPIMTNCYLLYDETSKEAALFDVGGPIDSLLTYIDENDLKLKYIFATHCHMDHVEGIPVVKKQFPDASVCFNREEYEDLQVFREWFEENIPPEELAEMKRVPGIAKWFSMDLADIGEPDIWLEDDKTYRLGGLKIKTILSPGHSRGSMCFIVGDVLFSGDVLFYRRVGRTDLLGGSSEAQVRSVQRLYERLPDETKVYPGHGQITDIGSEKTENRDVTTDTSHL